MKKILLVLLTLALIPMVFSCEKTKTPKEKLSAAAQAVGKYYSPASSNEWAYTVFDKTSSEVKADLSLINKELGLPDDLTVEMLDRYYDKHIIDEVYGPNKKFRYTGSYDGQDFLVKWEMQVPNGYFTATYKVKIK